MSFSLFSPSVVRKCPWLSVCTVREEFIANQGQFFLFLSSSVFDLFRGICSLCTATPPLPPQEQMLVKATTTTTDWIAPRPSINKYMYHQ